MSERLEIFGAGMAGLLAGQMLRRLNPVIFEAQPSLPNNHAALLRFRSAAVATALGIPFKKVKVRKAVKWDGRLQSNASISASNSYARKVTGKALDRSVLNLETSERYIGPPDLIAQMAHGLDIRYGQPLAEPRPGISTIPMPMMMDMVGWENKPDFSFRPIVAINVELQQTDLYQTLYYPELETSVYRASVVGNLLFIELVVPLEFEVKNLSATYPWPMVMTLGQVLGDFGLDKESYDERTLTFKYQKYGKILPIEDGIGKAFVVSLTDNYGLYSVGRFALWRQLLMDDVVNDVRIVESMMRARDGSYARRKHYHGS